MIRYKAIIITFLCVLFLSGKAQEMMPPAPHYEDASQWYIHDQNGVADIFYIISTETGDHMEGADICHFANTQDPLQRSQIFKEMAAVDSFYTGKLNYYSPYYRQASVHSLVDGKKLKSRILRAIEDVKDSWKYYLTHFNQGRPFVLAGYSQGAAAVIAILKEMPDSIAQRMVAAYVIGYKVTADDMDETPNLRPAKGATDCGVTVCFNSVASPDSELDIVSGGTQMCINPVNWRTDTVSATFIYDFPPVKEQLSVACDPKHHLLVVNGFKTDEILPIIGIPGNYHNFELRFYHPYICSNIADRVKAYLKAGHRKLTVKDEIRENTDCSAGVNLAYSEPLKRTLTPAPEGKTPFCIIYFGRHGSCYLSKPSDYDEPYKTLSTADSLHKLTPLGRNVLNRLDQIRQDARNHWGELTDLGVRGQKEIVWRMIERFPEIFNKDACHLEGRSLRNTRSLLSMEQMMNQVARECGIRVYHNASNEYSDYLNYQEESHLIIRNDSSAKAVYDAFAKKYADGDRLAKTLFADKDYIREHVDIQALNDQLFKIAGSLQNTSLYGKVTLYDLFTKDEIYHQWKKRNAWYYLNYGNYVCQTKRKGDLPYRLLHHLLAFTDMTLNNRQSAAFHLADETSFIPLVSLLGINDFGLETCRLGTLEDEGWADYRICPMSANLQWIFYRKNPEDKDVLIKILLNEREAILPLPSDRAPYYSVRDFLDYYQKMLNSYEK